MPRRRQSPGPAGYVFAGLAARSVGDTLATRRSQTQQRAAFEAWVLARQPLAANLRAVLADPAATPDLRDLATRVANGRMLTEGQEAHAWRLLTAARLFNNWAHEHQDLLKSLRAALNDPAANHVLRQLALQVTYGTSQLGPRPLSPRQETLAGEILFEMQARRVTIPQPDGNARPSHAAAGRQGAPGVAATSSPDRRADDRLARARARRRSLRESNKRFDSWAAAHQEVISSLRAFTEDPRVPFLRHLAIQVTDGWEGRRMPLTASQLAAVKRLFQARPDLRSAVPMSANPAGLSAPEGSGQHHMGRPQGPSHGIEPSTRTARQPGIEAGQ